MEEPVEPFVSEVNAQWKEIKKVHEQVSQKRNKLKESPDNDSLTDSLGYKLHNLYSAYEDLFKLVAGFFENQIDPTERYHIRLLKRMKLELEGIRPPLLSDQTFKLLDELRGFRHVFRHAYARSLNSSRLLELGEIANQVQSLFVDDFKRFKENIK